MTIHKLVTHGSWRTACGLGVPPLFEVKPTTTTWDNGDGITGVCTECHAPRNEQPPSALRRFDVLTEHRAKDGKVVAVRAGFAMENRDKSVSIVLDVLPIDGKLRLVPSEPAP